MHRPTNDPRRVVEEPRRSLFPYIVLAVLAAVTCWSIEQQWAQDSTQAYRQAPRQADAHVTGPASADVRTVFSASDYPADALRNDEQGTVQAELAIDSQGRVSGCAIVRSSGHDSLDNATCRILRQRARFSPAHDASGNPISATMTTPPVVWRLEG